MSGTECDEMGLWGVERAIHELKVLNRGERERERAGEYGKCGRCIQR